MFTHMNIVLLLILGIALSLVALPMLAQCTPGATAGDDNITCSTDPGGDYGADAGDDNIVLDNTVNTIYVVSGDYTGSTPGNGNDTITNNGTVSTILGDSYDGTGTGSDTIINNGSAGDLYGDAVDGDGLAGDSITNNGTTGSIFGDSQFGDSSGSDVIDNNGDVNLAIYGDSVFGTGSGNDTITNDGNVGVSGLGCCQDIVGDSRDGAGTGSDTITNNGDVAGSIYGDSINNATGSGNDTITNTGTVTDIYGDTAAGTGTGSDSITNSGTVSGNIIAGGGNDTVTLQDGASVGGTIDGGADYDILNFEFTSTDASQLDALAADIAAKNPSGGTITFNGRNYTWANFEELQALLSQLGITGNSFPFQGFCASSEWSAFDVYTIDANGNGEYAFSVTAGRIVWGIRVSFELQEIVLLNHKGDIAMYALPTGELMIRMGAYDFVFDYEAMCGPLPEEEEDPNITILEEEEEVEGLPVMTIISRPR